MPVHNWTKQFQWLFHDFHGDWIQVIKHTLNSGVLPPEYYALSEQSTAGVIPDVLALEHSEADDPRPSNAGGTGLLVASPKAKIFEQTGPEFYHLRQRRVAVRHSGDDRVVAVVEIVSPGNKNNKTRFRAFLDKVYDLLQQKIHVLVIDVHAPGRHDPAGVHAAIWEEVWESPKPQPPGKHLTVASYECSDSVAAYVEPVAVGDVLPDMPLFLVPGGHVLVPLEKTYQAAWLGVPARWRKVIEPGGN